jgi:NADH:ubiquinone oxidoreductase subunit 5 (subunit L)/multisubunit Na+/H+ antiporter MnhA subunit
VLHVVNHALFKSLLFLGAGSVLHAAGTGVIDRLGGLLKRMPSTGAAFLIGAAAISGLPPLNGFISEFLIYLAAIGSLSGGHPPRSAWLLMSVVVVGSLALIGGLAATCFTKAFGIVFLGQPRSREATAAYEPGAAMRWPMMILAGCCVLIGLTAPLWPPILAPVVATVLPPELAVSASVAAREAVTPLLGVTGASLMLAALAFMLMRLRRKLLSGRPVEQTETWGCGYAAPTPRMQYTASSFAQPLMTLFRLLVPAHDEVHEPRGLFPREARLHTHTPDMFRRAIYEPFFLSVAWVVSKLRWLQEGRIQIYVLYIALTILVLLVWKLN